MAFLKRFLVATRDVPSGGPRDLLLKDVATHLEDILDSKRGFASQLHDFGLVDYTAQMTGRNVAQSLIREILGNIASYEPRLVVRSLRALSKDEDHRLHFVLRARLGEAPCVFHLAFWMTFGALRVIDARWAEPGEDGHGT